MSFTLRCESEKSTRSLSVHVHGYSFVICWSWSAQLSRSRIEEQVFFVGHVLHLSSALLNRVRWCFIIKVFGFEAVTSSNPESDCSLRVPDNLANWATHSSNDEKFWFSQQINQTTSTETSNRVSIMLRPFAVSICILVLLRSSRKSRNELSIVLAPPLDHDPRINYKFSETSCFFEVHEYVTLSTEFLIMFIQCETFNPVVVNHSNHWRRRFNLEIILSCLLHKR